MGTFYGKNGASLITTNLQQYLDPGNTTSYNGTGATLTDLSVNAKNATLVNTPTYTSGTSGYFTFTPASKQYISCGNFGSFYNKGTVSWWMYSTDVASYRNPIHSHYLGSNVGFRFEQSATNYLGMLFGNDAGTYAGHSYANGNFYPNTWYFMTLSWDQSTNTCKGYINSTRVMNDANTVWATTMPSLSIGGGGFADSAERWYQGRIGPTLVYNTQLTDAQVAQNYASFKGRYGLA